MGSNTYDPNIDNMGYAVKAVLNSFYDDSVVNYQDEIEKVSMPVSARKRTYYSNRSQIAKSIIDSGYDLPTSTIEVEFGEDRKMIACESYLELYDRYTDYLQHWDNEKEKVFTAIQNATTESDLSCITWKPYIPLVKGGRGE